MKKYSLLLISTFLISACSGSSSKDITLVPQVTFQNFEQITLPVSSIEIENNYDPLIVPNNKATTFPTPPDVALRRYFESRYVPNTEAQGLGVLKVSIDDASVKHGVIKSEEAFQALFGFGEAEEYDLDVILNMRYIGTDDIEKGFAKVDFDKVKTYSKKLSLSELEAELNIFVEEMVRSIDIPVQENIAKILAAVKEQQKILADQQNAQFDDLKEILPEDEGVSENTAPTQMLPIVE